MKWSAVVPTTLLLTFSRMGGVGVGVGVGMAAAAMLLAGDACTRLWWCGCQHSNGKRRNSVRNIKSTSQKVTKNIALPQVP